jgi:hypothetical protein
MLAIILVTAGTALALWAYFRAPDTAQYAPVISLLNAGQLNADRGRIDLAKSFPGLSPNDQMYLTRRPDGSYVAMFPTYCGKGFTIAGLLYSSRPLTQSDTYSAAWGTNLSQRFIDVGSWKHLILNHRIDEHWYRVSRMD